MKKSELRFFSLSLNEGMEHNFQKYTGGQVRRLPANRGFYDYDVSLKKKWKSGHLRFIWGAGVRKKLRHWHIPFLLLIFYLPSALIVSYGKNFPLFSLRAHTKTFFLVIMRTMTSHEAASAGRVTGVFSAFVVSEHCSKTMSEKVHHTLLNDSDEKKTNNYYSFD